MHGGNQGGQRERRNATRAKSQVQKKSIDTVIKIKRGEDLPDSNLNNAMNGQAFRYEDTRRLKKCVNNLEKWIKKANDEEKVKKIQINHYFHQIKKDQFNDIAEALFNAIKLQKSINHKYSKILIDFFRQAEGKLCFLDRYYQKNGKQFFVSLVQMHRNLVKCIKKFRKVGPTIKEIKQAKTRLRNQNKDVKDRKQKQKQEKQELENQKARQQIQRVREAEKNELRRNKIKYLVRVAPSCPSLNLCPGLLQQKKCPNGNHFIIECQVCRWNEHQCPSQKNSLEEENKIRIVSAGERIIDYDPIKRVCVSTRKNNISSILQKQGYQYISAPVYLKGIPELRTKYPVLPSPITEQILKNREEEHYLPLKIKKSKIPDAGLGVFATESIPADAIVCSYLGEIGVGKHMPATRKYKTNDGEQVRPNNSLFTLGWVQKYDILMICPNKYSNVGRFINSEEPSRCNLLPQLCIMEKRDGSREFCVYLISTREINKNEELFYDYGKHYK